MAVANIPGSFLWTDMFHDHSIVSVRLCGVLYDLLVRIDPSKFADKLS